MCGGRLNPEVRTYQVRVPGWKLGQNTLKGMSERHRDYIVNVVAWAVSLTFKELIASVVRDWPEMGENLVYTRHVEGQV